MNYEGFCLSGESRRGQRGVAGGRGPHRATAAEGVTPN